MYDDQHDPVFDDPAYEAYQAELARMCGRAVEYGTASDPSGTTCDQEAGHGGEHSGPDAFGEGRLFWTGGGYCAGDPLPVRGMRYEVGKA